MLESILGRVSSLLEMSNLRPADTGIEGVVIWVSAGSFAGRDSQHGPRIKVIFGAGKVTDETLASAPSVKLDGSLVPGHDLDAKTLKQVRRFLKANREVLQQYWDQTIGTGEMVRRIVSV